MLGMLQLLFQCLKSGLLDDHRDLSFTPHPKPCVYWLNTHEQMRLVLFLLEKRVELRPKKEGLMEMAHFRYSQESSTL